MVDTTCASYAIEKPVIDGKIGEDEWNKQTLMQTSTIDNVVYPATWTGKLWSGPDDQSAKAYAMWDEEKIYFCWDVTDDVFSQEYDDFYTWQGDSVQFGVYMGSDDEYIALGEANTTFTEIGIAKTPKGPQCYRFSAQDANKHNSELMSESEYELAIDVDGNKTIYELSIPWESLLPDGISPKANSRLGFSFLVNDNDGAGRRGAILFAGGIFFTKDSSQFTYINLIGKN